MNSAREEETRRSTSSMRWLILFGVWLTYFCFGLTISSLAPLVGPISADLGIGNTEMGLIFGAWPMTYILAAVPSGILLDRLGARKMLALATFVMATSGLARSVAETEVQMLLAVALFGIGGPMISVGAPKIIARLFEGKTRATAMGIYITGPYLGGILALSLTNSVLMPLADDNWRGVVAIYAGLVAVSGGVWFAIASLPEARKQSGDHETGKKFDLRAFREILRLREVQLVLALSIGIFFFNHGLNNWLPEVLRAHGYTAVEAGYLAAIPSSVGILSALLIPRIAVPERRLAVMALLIILALTASLLLRVSSGPILMSGLVIQGIARGAMMTVAILLLMETPRVPEERLGLAGGLFFTFAEIGGVLGPIAFGALADVSNGFAVPLGALTAACLILLSIVVALREQLRGGDG